MVFQYNHRNWLPEIASECQVKATEACEVRETQLLLPHTLGLPLMKFRGGKRKTRFFKYVNLWPKDQNNEFHEFQCFHDLMFVWFHGCWRSQTQIHARCRDSHGFPDVPLPFLLQNHTKGSVTQAFEDPSEVAKSVIIQSFLTCAKTCLNLFFTSV